MNNLCKALLLSCCFFSSISTAQTLSIAEMEAFFQSPPNIDYSTLDDDDETLVCYGTKHYPEKVHREYFNTYYGGIGDMRIPVCQEYLLEYKIPQTEPYIDQLYKLSGIATAEGTMWYSVLKILQFERIEATTLPLRNTSARQQWAKEYSEGSGYDDTDAYLKSWSTQGNWERREYTKLKNYAKTANLAMRDYYQQTFDLDETQAQETADYYVNALQNSYLGRFHRE